MVDIPRFTFTGHNNFSQLRVCCLQAAAALLFSQLLYNGAAVEVQPEQILLAALSEFTDIAQVSLAYMNKFAINCISK